jgi:hypothetical protein
MTSNLLETLDTTLKDAKEMTWSNTSSAVNSVQENTYLNLRRQMQDMSQSNYSTENEAIKYDIGLNFKKKQDYDSYGYYADEEKNLKNLNSDPFNEYGVIDNFKKKMGNEVFVESGVDEKEYLIQNNRRKFQMYDSDIESTQSTTSKQRGNASSILKEDSKLLGSKKVKNIPESQKNLESQHSGKKQLLLFKNEYITSIGRIDNQSSRNEILNSNFVNQVTNIQELGNLLEMKQIKEDPLKEKLEQITSNLSQINEKTKLKNLSFKVFNEETQKGIITFNHFIDVTAEVDDESIIINKSQTHTENNSLDVKEKPEGTTDAKHWSNLRAFGTGINQRIIDDSFTTNNTVNFLVTNNSANNLKLQVSNLTDITGNTGNIENPKNPSRFKTESKVLLMFNGKVP